MSLEFASSLTPKQFLVNSFVSSVGLTLEHRAQ